MGTRTIKVGVELIWVDLGRNEIFFALRSGLVRTRVCCIEVRYLEL